MNNPEKSRRKKRRIKVGRKERREAGKGYTNVCVFYTFIYLYSNIILYLYIFADITHISSIYI